MDTKTKHYLELLGYTLAKQQGATFTPAQEKYFANIRALYEKP